MGLEDMSRRRAFCKMVSLVQSVNVIKIKQEQGLPTAMSLAADPAVSLLRTTQPGKIQP